MKLKYYKSRIKSGLWVKDLIIGVSIIFVLFNYGLEKGLAVIVAIYCLLSMGFLSFNILSEINRKYINKIESKNNKIILISFINFLISFALTFIFFNIKFISFIIIIGIVSAIIVGMALRLFGGKI